MGQKEDWSSGNVEGTPFSKYQLAQINPFDDRVCGVKIPDSNTYPSIAIYCNDDWTLAYPSATANAMVWAFQPNISTALISGTPAGASSWTWSATWGGTTTSSRQSSVQNNYDMIRPVAHGLRLSSPVSTTSATGYVHVCICAARTTKTTWDFPASISEMSNMAWYARYTLSQLTQKPILIVNKFLDSVANRYIDTSNNGTKSGDNPPSGAVAGTTFGQIQVANEWCTVIIAVEGTNTAAASGFVPVSVESIVHYEAIPGRQSTQIGTNAAPAQERDLGGAAHMSATLPPTTPDDAESLAARMRSAGMAVLRSGADFLATPTGQAAARSVIAYYANGGTTANDVNAIPALTR